MPKPTKKSDLNKRWQLRNKPLKRKYRTREERERILIVCEGEKTEPNYFKALKKQLPRHVVEVCIHGTGTNTLSLIEKAIDIREREELNQSIGFDHTWVVFDRDSFPEDNFDNAIAKAESKKIDSAWSNEAFEIWYLLHFQERSTAMSRKDYPSALTNHLGEKYEKNNPDTYCKLATLGNQADAIRRAESLRELHSGTTPAESNPCTNVDLLVQQLNRHKIM